VNRSAADDWSIARSLAFLAAIFAVVLGSLLPAAAVAASPDGRPLVLCSAEGPQVAHIRADLDGGRGERHDGGPKCAACITPLAAALPTPAEPVALPAPALRPGNTTVVGLVAPPPPSQAPPRPPSTAPPIA
jgi:hypothetical protein